MLLWFSTYNNRNENVFLLTPSFTNLWSGSQSMIIHVRDHSEYEIKQRKVSETRKTRKNVLNQIIYTYPLQVIFRKRSFLRILREETNIHLCNHTRGTGRYLIDIILVKTLTLPVWTRLSTRNVFQINLSLTDTRHGTSKVLFTTFLIFRTIYT